MIDAAESYTYVVVAAEGYTDSVVGFATVDLGASAVVAFSPTKSVGNDPGSHLVTDEVMFWPGQFAKRSTEVVLSVLSKRREPLIRQQVWFLSFADKEALRPYITIVF